MVSIALVLGAGGVLGSAYHAGALAAVAEATGWDPRTADLIVGTSAGAHTAASLRAGLSAGDHYARGLDRVLSDEGAELTGELPGRMRLPDLAVSPVRPPWGWLPQAPWLVGPAFLRPGPARWGVALAGLVPAGTHPTHPLGERVRAMHDGRWPEAPTWVVAYRLRDGRRVVFGRDDVDVPDLATAVEASSAIPGRFRPVRLGADRYLDGAVFSPTNADLVAGLAFDLVVVSSPMSAAPGALDGDGSLGARARRWFGGLLEREITAVVDKGTAVLVLEPTPADLAEMLAPGDEHDRSPAVTESAFRSTSERLVDPATSGAVGLLRA